MSQGIFVLIVPGVQAGDNVLIRGDCLFQSINLIAAETAEKNKANPFVFLARVMCSKFE